MNMGDIVVRQVIVDWRGKGRTFYIAHITLGGFAGLGAYAESPQVAVDKLVAMFDEMVSSI